MQSQNKSCLKCGYARTDADRSAPAYACPRCRAVYAKVEQARRALLVADTVPSAFDARPLRDTRRSDDRATGLRWLSRWLLRLIRGRAR